MASAKTKINEKCPICLEEMEGDDVIRLRCMHLFHKDCFGQLLIHRDKYYSFIKCPICRTETDVEGDVDYVEINDYNKSQKNISNINKKELEDAFDEFLELQEYLVQYDSITGENKENIDCGDFIDELLILYKHKNDTEKEDIVDAGLKLCNDFKEKNSYIKTGGKINKKRKYNTKKNHHTKRNKSKKKHHNKKNT